MHAFIVIDLGFGDAGKGSLVDFLARQHQAHTVIRFNGGAQAAHNVVTPDGRHHTFSQFGSGTFVPGVRTHLSRFMLLDPVALLQEEAHLRLLGIPDAFDRLSVDQNAPVVSPFQKAANRLRELARGDARHGSCGMGIGETMADLMADESQVLRVADLREPSTLRAKLRALQESKRCAVGRLPLPSTYLADREWQLLCDAATVEEFAELFADMAPRLAIVPSSDAVLRAPGNIIFEGAQGVLLDEWFGFHPYTTWSTTTFANALTLLRECRYPGRITRLGALRAYMTRHGPGPFVTEDATLASRIPELHNGTNDGQHDFRVGWLDLVMLRYALQVAGGVDALALTCLDHLQKSDAWNLCRRYQDPHPDFFAEDRLKVAGTPDLNYQTRLTATLQVSRPICEHLDPAVLPTQLEESLGYPVAVTSAGPTCLDKRFLHCVGQTSGLRYRAPDFPTRPRVHSSAISL